MPINGNTIVSYDGRTINTFVIDGGHMIKTLISYDGRTAASPLHSCCIHVACGIDVAGMLHFEPFRNS